MGHCLFFLLTFLLVLSPPSASAEVVRFGVMPAADPASLERALVGLVSYLEEATGDEILLSVARDYRELADRLREGSLDLAWLNTASYVRLTDEMPQVGYLVTYMERDRTTGEVTDHYRALLVTLKRSGIASLEEARGKILAFTDPLSTSGCVYPRLMLCRLGIDERSHFRKVFFLRRHDRVIEALLSGAVDVGAVSEGILVKARRERGDLFAVLAASDPIPLSALVAASHVPQQRRELYRRVLTAIPADHPFLEEMWRHLSWPAAGFSVRDDAFYDSAREALAHVF